MRRWQKQLKTTEYQVRVNKKGLYMKDPVSIIIPPDSKDLYLFPIGQIEVDKQRSPPYSPCYNCLVRPMCDTNRQLGKCQPFSDYYNALIHKDPTIVCTFIISRYGIWEPFTFNGSKNCTIEDLIQASIGKQSMANGTVFDYDKYLEYTKHLESLEYYHLLPKVC